MSEFRWGIVLGILITVSLIIWQPQLAKDWGSDARAMLIALPAKIKQQTQPVPPREKLTTEESLKRKLIVLNAQRYLGLAFVLGGNDPAKGFDCSGLVQHTLFVAGLKAPRIVEDQYEMGAKVDKKQIIPGDLLFFQVYSSGNPFGRGMNSLTKHLSWMPNHVGIYMGKGEMIHSPRTGKNVEKVSIKKGFWADHLMGARDPFGR